MRSYTAELLFCSCCLVRSLWEQPPSAPSYSPFFSLRYSRKRDMTFALCLRWLLGAMICYNGPPWQFVSPSAMIFKDLLGGLINTQTDAVAMWPPRLRIPLKAPLRAQRPLLRPCSSFREVMRAAAALFRAAFFATPSILSPTFHSFSDREASRRFLVSLSEVGRVSRRARSSRGNLKPTVNGGIRRRYGRRGE